MNILSNIETTNTYSMHEIDNNCTEELISEYTHIHVGACTHTYTCMKRDVLISPIIRLSMWYILDKVTADDRLTSKSPNSGD